MIIIVCSDKTGGVRTSCKLLLQGLSGRSLKCKKINLSDLDRGLSGAYTNLRKLVKCSKDDILILSHFYPIFLGVFLKTLGYKKIINVVHTDLAGYYNSVNFIKKIIVKTLFLVLKKDPLVFVSKEAELKAKTNFGLKNTTTIHNIYKPKDIEKHQTRPYSHLRLGSVSRLSKTKNIDFLIRIFKRVTTSFPDIELLIFGTGPESSNLSKYIVAQDCSKFVKLLGTHEDKSKIYSSIDGLISFSSLEGFSMVILESISYGKPVFHTDCSCGPREIMASHTDPFIKTESFEKTNTGYLVRPLGTQISYEKNIERNEIFYANLLKKFINDIKNGRFNMKYDHNKFSEEVVVDQWQSLLKKTYGIVERSDS